jgi:DMSO/TMAO reductase YedYZ molybdopterin-dependent catalytic subunit
MGVISRRQLLSGAVGRGAPARVYGCSSESNGFTSASADAGVDALLDGLGPDAGAGPCADPFAGGELLGVVPFAEDHADLDVAFGDGLNGRLYTDLTKLGPDALVTSNETHYIRTRYPDLIDPTAAWKIAVTGLVEAPLDITLDILAPMVKKDLGPFVMECSGNGEFAAFGMLSAARWSGVPIEGVLAMAKPLSSATRVLVSGFDQHSQTAPTNSTPGASWVFTLEQLAKAGAILATEMNGVALPKDHGFPVRLLVPNWYGCTNIKWVDAITLVDDGVAATSQMQEYSTRTHQTGTPALARDYVPATIDQAAMPVRIEKWRVNGQVLYRVVGIMWGGYQVTDKLMIRFTANEDWVPVDVCPKQATNGTWTLWSHAWKPSLVGPYSITLNVDDAAIPTKRLDLGFYRRRTTITEV